MKILIDECLPSELKETLTTMGHDCVLLGAKSGSPDRLTTASFWPLPKAVGKSCSPEIETSSISKT